ncbi:MAG: phosphomannomutase/phosphoglucomutase [Deltaproteobacteria bacterium]|nr:phosphomannomutase/phosphoglucomutase [Deltaproteobacteria bacterium]
MDPVIFRKYDIRAVVDKELDDTGVINLGQAMGTYFQTRGVPRITLGRDGRLSSDRYAALFTEGLISTGLSVADLGLVTTPMLYFSVYALKHPGGVMITASHNPAQYNGFKICVGPHAMMEAEIQAIRALAHRGDFYKGKGTVEQVDVAPAYLEYLLNNIDIQRPVAIGVDTGNGSVGPIAQAVYEGLGLQARHIYADVDGRFPNHPPDPTIPKNMKDLGALVKQHDLEAGLGFDGDGDRVGVVDETGRLIYGDRLLLIFAREILARRPGAAIVGDVKCSDSLFREIEQRGGRATMWKTGHALIKHKMEEEKAALGGEMSGHIIFADRYFGFDDGIYAALRLVEILARDSRPLSEYLADVPEGYITPEIQISCPDRLKSAVVAEVREALRRDYQVNDIDGVRVGFEHGWGLLRASQTMPKVVMRFEADTEEELNRIRSIFESQVIQVIQAVA